EKAAGERRRSGFAHLSAERGSKQPPVAVFVNGPLQRLSEPGLLGWRCTRIRYANRSTNAMCDYSLHHVASRDAKVGDKLVSTNFIGTITRGFAEVGAPN